MSEKDTTLVLSCSRALCFFFSAQAWGTIISANYPLEKNLKRKKPHPEEEQIPWYPLELRNFPHWTLCDDIKTIILSLGPGSQRVRIIHYDPEPSLSVARAYFREEEDRDAIEKALIGYEISPGYVLQVSALPRTHPLILSWEFSKQKSLSKTMHTYAYTWHHLTSQSVAVLIWCNGLSPSPKWAKFGRFCQSNDGSAYERISEPSTSKFLHCQLAAFGNVPVHEVPASTDMHTYSHIHIHITWITWMTDSVSWLLH